MKVSKMIDDKNRIVSTEVYVTKTRRYLHINIEGTDGVCPICMEEHSLKAHHLIPRRLKTKNKALKELRIRICDGCHKKIHPENEHIHRENQLANQIFQLRNAVDWEEVQSILQETEHIIPYDHLAQIKEKMEKGLNSS